MTFRAGRMIARFKARLKFFLDCLGKLLPEARMNDNTVRLKAKAAILEKHSALHRRHEVHDAPGARF